MEEIRQLKEPSTIKTTVNQLSSHFAEDNIDIRVLWCAWLNNRTLGDCSSEGDRKMLNPEQATILDYLNNGTTALNNDAKPCIIPVCTA